MIHKAKELLFHQKVVTINKLFLITAVSVLAIIVTSYIYLLAVTTSDQNSQKALALVKSNSIAIAKVGEASGNSVARNNNTFLTFNNPFLGIKLQYPSNWVVAQHSLNRIFITQFLSPVGNTSQTLPASVSISLQKLPANITTLNQYTDIAYKILKQIYTTAGGEFNIIESNNSTTLAGTIPAFERVFTVQQHFLDKNLKIMPIDFKVEKLYGINANKIYVITFTSEASEFNNYLPVAQKMIDSFNIMPTGRPSNLVTANTGSNITSHTAATFHSTFDTYILPGSARGYGLYSEPNSNQSFLQGDTAELYVQLMGIGQRVANLNQNTTTALSNGKTTTTSTPVGQTDLTANILLFDKKGKEVLATQYKVPHKVVPIGQHQYITIPIQIPNTLPSGQYHIRYFIMDRTTGKNLEIDKNIVVMVPKLQATAS